MSKKMILIIEDEESFVELLKFRLEANGYRIEVAFDGEEGLKKLKELGPDLVILDVMMPKIDGYKVCRLAKDDKKTKNIPIIMLTAKTQQKDVEDSVKAGADAYISKPFEPLRLLNEIKRLVVK